MVSMRGIERLAAIEDGGADDVLFEAVPVAIECALDPEMSAAV